MTKRARARLRLCLSAALLLGCQAKSSSPVLFNQDGGLGADGGGGQAGQGGEETPGGGGGEAGNSG
ncbi:hypothetical protein KJ940_13105, partial [Myxococcota bacterium]|nr:hypothetical protein [Myxococcota bacterium]